MVHEDRTPLRRVSLHHTDSRVGRHTSPLIVRLDDPRPIAVGVNARIHAAIVEHGADQAARVNKGQAMALADELGHVLGLEHCGEGEVMAPTLDVGIRRLPDEALPGLDGIQGQSSGTTTADWWALLAANPVPVSFIDEAFGDPFAWDYWTV